ncbi:hypothetical protein D3C76_1465770 [compost metagenome]
MPVHVQCQQTFAVAGGSQGGYRQVLFAQVGQGGMLCFKLKLGIAAVAGFEHIAGL